MGKKEKSLYPILIAFQKVYSRPGYLLFSLVVFLFVIIILLLFQNWTYYQFLWSGVFQPVESIGLMFGSIMVFPGNFEQINFIVLIIVLILLSINSSFVAFTLKDKIINNSKIGIVSNIVSLLGVGCASCGSVLLSFILGSSVSSWFLRFLPYNGAELGYISILLLLFSIYLAAKKISNPIICKIK